VNSVGRGAAHSDVNPTQTIAKAKPRQSRAKRLLRGLFRWLRTALLLFLLIAAVLLLFFSRVGIPEFVKDRIILQARSKGLDVQFSRLRWRWSRGLVAENLQIKGTNESSAPQIFVEQAECPLSSSALKNFELKINSLRLRGGRLVWPLAVTNQPRRTVQFNDLDGQLFFHEDGGWELRSLHGEFHGIKLELTGTLDNARMLRQQQFPRPAKRGSASFAALLGEIESCASQLKFTGRPELRLRFNGDGKDLSTLRAHLYFSVPAMESRWGSGTNLVVSGQVIPSGNALEAPAATLKLTANKPLTAWGHAKSINLDLELKPLFLKANKPAVLSAANPPEFSDAATAGGTLAAMFLPTNVSLSIELARAETRWGESEHLLITTKSSSNPTNTSQPQMAITAAAQEIQSDWGRANNAQLATTLSISPTNHTSTWVGTDLRLYSVQTRWGDAQEMQVHAQGSLPPTNEFHLFQRELIWPERLENLPFEATANVRNIRSRQLAIESVALTLESQSRQLRLESSGRISEGEFALNGLLDTSNRELQFSGLSRVDPKKLSSLLSTNIQKWLTNSTFQTRPKLEARGRLVLPAWTNRPPEWTREVLPTISLAGEFSSAAGTVRGVSFASAQSPFSLTNLIWRMPRLTVTLPQGGLEAEYVSSLPSRDFYWRIHSQLDVAVAKPFLQNESARQGLDFFRFATPPSIDAEFRGRWGDTDRLDVQARVGATNFSFRGEAVKDCQTRLQYTNDVLRFTDSQIQREHGERGTASAISIDLREQKLYFTNGWSTLNPYVVARAVDNSALEAIGSYQFDSPPTVRVNGALDLKRNRYEDDLHFDISGHHFRWQEIRLPQLAGTVNWLGQTLTLTNVAGALQTGRLAGSAHFDFSALGGTEFSFAASVMGADLRELAASLGGKSNKVEGLFSAEFILTHGNAADPKSWQGHGQLDLRDGLLWDIPMFSVFSPVLNAFVPGLGNSRANEASATVLLTDGLFSSKDLEIRATMMRMELRGSVDLNRRVDARVEAELLRDVPAVGLVISKVFWPVTKLFEYKVSGTLAEPKAEPLYVLPKVLLMPFHPLKSLRELFSEQPKPAP